MITPNQKNMDQQGTTNGATGLIISGAGAAISAATAKTSWWDSMEQILRMGASVVAIISGLVAIVSGIVWLYYTIKKNRKTK